MTITSVCAICSFTLRRTSRPSPPFPIRRSVMTTSKSPAESARSAVARFSACSTACPSAVRRMSSMVRMLSLSSTTSSRAMVITLPRARRAHRFLVGGQRQRDREGAAPARLAPHRDPAVVPFDDAVDDGQAEAGAACLGGEEGIEDARQVLGGDSLARVLDLEHGLAGLATQPHPELAAGLGRVARVAEQVPEDRLDLTRVPRPPA